MKLVIRSIVSATLALTATHLACAATAADTPIQVPVNYAGLDLSTTAGAKVMYARLHAAAEQVCEPLDGADLSLSVRHRACIQKAMSNAVREVDKPLLTQIYAERTGDASFATVAFAK
jgi:UrcA family protein